jgi:MFS family permease
MTWVSRLFLTGFASTALFGPVVGRLCDSYGRKAGTLAFSLLYSLGAYSTKSPLLSVLLVGRVLGGIGTSLLFSAPEAWLVGEAGREGVESSLGDTFGLVSTKLHTVPYHVYLILSYSNFKHDVRLMLEIRLLPS